MPRSRPTVMFLLSIGLLACTGSASAQLPVEDWMPRPDARAPAGISEDAFLSQGGIEVSYTFRVMSYEDLLFETDEIPPILVLSGTPQWPAFDMVPLSMSRQRHEFEARVGLLDWLGASVRVPFVSNSAELATENLVGSPSASGLGDIEFHLLYALHQAWPYRAHLSIGAAVPTGSVEEIGQLPNAPFADQLLPYPLQPGDGTLVLLPGAAFVAENEAGTVGIRGHARIPIGENDRGWTRGGGFEGSLWMAYRFTDWVSGSVRIHFRKTGSIEGFDPDVDHLSSPMAHPELQGGTRIELPIGINIRFAEGPLRRNLIRAEFLLPVHQNLDGPQLKAKYGAAFSWSVGII
ncbi:MAG: hypothetical protein WEG36_03740 [Gemmatimonadota bacterium]